MKYLILYLLSTFVSCKSLKADNVINDKSIELQVLLHIPYCGGTPPDEVQEKGIQRLFTDQQFIIKNAKKEEVISFYQKEMDTINLLVPLGKYTLFLNEKESDYNDFKNIFNKTSVHLQYKGDECLKEWYNKADAAFEVNDETTKIVLVIPSYCDTGINPCLQYIGPKRP